MACVDTFFKKCCFLLTLFSPVEGPLRFDGRFSTSFVTMFPQSLGFYINSFDGCSSPKTIYAVFAVRATDF